MGLQNRGAMADVIAKTVRETCRLRSPEPSKPEIREAIAVELRDEGVCRLGALLDGDAVARARAVLDKAPLSAAAAGNRTFARDEALGSVNVGTVDERAGLSACEELLVAANHPSILAGVEAFLGAPPTVQYYTAWWSFAGRSAAREAQLFHYDRNCFRFVKLFIYLTDVDETHGPHVYVRGSANVADWERRLEHAKRADPDNAERFLAMINAVRKNDQDVEDFFGRDRIETLTGRAGEAFLVDTSGIHKGLLPEQADRLVFQATYALLPMLKEPARPVPMPGLAEACDARYRDALDREYLAYVNRIAVSDQAGYRGS